MGDEKKQKLIRFLQSHKILRGIIIAMIGVVLFVKFWIKKWSRKNVIYKVVACCMVCILILPSLGDAYAAMNKSNLKPKDEKISLMDIGEDILPASATTPSAVTHSRELKKKIHKKSTNTKTFRV